MYTNIVIKQLGTRDYYSIRLYVNGQFTDKFNSQACDIDDAATIRWGTFFYDQAVVTCFNAEGNETAFPTSL